MVKKPDKSEDHSANNDGKCNKRGRKKSKEFEFAECFELMPSHTQMLRVKICTLKLYSSPPAFPGKEPPKEDKSRWRRWKKKADRFRAYFLILFRPESDL